MPPNESSMTPSARRNGATPTSSATAAGCESAREHPRDVRLAGWREIRVPTRVPALVIRTTPVQARYHEPSAGRSGRSGFPIVEMVPSLAADLAALTSALGRADTDLAQSLEGLAANTRRAVDSYLGVMVTIVNGGYPVTVALMDSSDEPTPIASSAQVPLRTVSGAEPGSAIVFYASRPGAFVDFAADAAFMLELPLEAISLDSHLIGPDENLRASGLDDLSAINQAIGVLLGRGQSIERARRTLADDAAREKTTVVWAARALLRSVITTLE
jgi:hypothetical protein